MGRALRWAMNHSAIKSFLAGAAFAFAGVLAGAASAQDGESECPQERAEIVCDYWYQGALESGFVAGSEDAPEFDA